MAVADLDVLAPPRDRAATERDVTRHAARVDAPLHTEQEPNAKP